MLRNVYRLVAPRTFEPVQVSASAGPDTVVVRPTHLSICNSDMRYYLGKRDPEALAEKLPMALIHEGIGEVVSCRAGEFARGERVVMLPNAPVESDEFIAENYLRTSRFCGSGFDGFMQEYMLLPRERVLALPDGMQAHVAAFTELVSVAMHALSRFASIAHARRNRIGVWGDGNLGFIVALLVRTAFPETDVFVVGRTQRKLADFTFATATYLSNDVADMPLVDHAFECCGGDGSAAAIEQIIDCIRPEGAISLLGVSENPPPINTRMVLEKGLRLFGSSRSGRVDFERTVELYRAHPEVPDYLQALVGHVASVRTVADMARAFEADTQKPGGKTIMEWDV